MNLSRRNLLVGSGTIFAALALPGPVQATSARALTLPQLRKRASRVVVGKPVLHEAQWAKVGGTRRIITRTRFIQESDWLRAGHLDDRHEDEVEIWRLGGRVGDIMQKVPGEARLSLDEPVLLFLEESEDVAQHIVGMGQGSYPILRSQAEPELTRSADLPHLLGAKTGADVPELERPAVDVLHRRSLSRAFALIRSTR